MPSLQPWFERRFAFDLPLTAAPGLLERLRGTPARVERRLSGLSVARLTARPDGRWSIQENLGHLLDLEPLWLGRVDDLMAGVPEMRVADLSNRQTHEADHNARRLEDLLGAFDRARALLVGRLEAAGEPDWIRSARHPRLQSEMRLLDLAFFVAEHDDHHLATITELLRR